MKYLIFASLKVIEIGAFIFVPYLVAKYLGRLLDDCDYGFWEHWWHGLVILFIMWGGLFAIYGIVTVLIPAFVHMNWEWAEKIAGGVCL